MLGPFSFIWGGGRYKLRASIYICVCIRSIRLIPLYSDAIAKCKNVTPIFRRRTRTYTGNNTPGWGEKVEKMYGCHELKSEGPIFVRKNRRHRKNQNAPGRIARVPVVSAHRQTSVLRRLDVIIVTVAKSETFRPPSVKNESRRNGLGRGNLIKQSGRGYVTYSRRPSSPRTPP